MQTYKVTLVFTVTAEDAEDAYCLATEMADRATDSIDGEVGECVDRTVEQM